MGDVIQERASKIAAYVPLNSVEIGNIEVIQLHLKDAMYLTTLGCRE